MSKRSAAEMASEAAAAVIYDREIFVAVAMTQAELKRFLDRHECAICMNVVQRPYNIDCGHLFCGSCLDQHHNSKKPSAKCPVCGSKLPASLVSCSRVASVQNTLNGMEVKCVNHSVGCRETMTIGVNNRNITAHRNRCQFEVITCLECDTDIRRSAFEHHNSNECTERIVSCQLCEAQFTFNRLGSHAISASECVTVRQCYNQCVTPAGSPLLLLACDTDSNSKYSSMSEHLCHECPLQEIHCEVCWEAVKRKDINAHYNSNMMHHSKRQQQEHQQLRQLVNQQQQTISMQRAQISALVAGGRVEKEEQAEATAATLPAANQRFWSVSNCLALMSGHRYNIFDLSLFPSQRLQIGCRIVNTVNSTLAMITSTEKSSVWINVRSIAFSNENKWYTYGTCSTLRGSAARVLPTVADVPLNQRALLLINTKVYFLQPDPSHRYTLSVAGVARVLSRSACGTTVVVVKADSTQQSVPVELCAPLRTNQECECL